MLRVKQPRLTPVLHQQIVAATRAGGYLHIAAQAFGVSPPELEELLRRGEAPRARGLVRLFAGDVRQAVAQARLRAEMEVFKADPKHWLTLGPGRDRADSPGWSVAVKPLLGEVAVRSALEDHRFLELLRMLMPHVPPESEAYQTIMRLPDIGPIFRAA